MIADDLTGGADAGAQFAKRGLRTFLVSLDSDMKLDLDKFHHYDVLAVNTDSRILNPEQAFDRVSGLLIHYRKDTFPIIYKKIDSTLRGNIGYEIDALLEKTNGLLSFVAPSYPEQSRRLVGGILIVGEKPLALTEVARHTPSPVQESHVYKILQNQSKNSVGWIDLTHVASAPKTLKKVVEEAEAQGHRIIIFDAVSRQDLENIAEVGFSLKKRPIFVGSAGLAEEVAKKIGSFKEELSPHPFEIGFKHILMISGTASSVTRQQLQRIEQNGIPSYTIPKILLENDETKEKTERRELIQNLSKALSQGKVILKTIPELFYPDHSKDFPIHQKIVKTLADLAVSSMEDSNVDSHHLALVLTGGETAQNVLNRLGNDGMEIEGELLGGIVKGVLVGGKWNGLTVITKAGAFGREDALEKIVSFLEGKCSIE